MDKQKQKGFSLIEIIVTLFIMGVIFLIYNATVNTLNMNRNIKDEESAFRMADAEIGTLRYNGYSSLPNSGNVNDPLLTTLPHGATESLTITTYTGNSKQVKVTVTWNEPASPIPHSVNLTTLVTKGGLGS